MIICFKNESSHGSGTEIKNKYVIFMKLLSRCKSNLNTILQSNQMYSNNVYYLPLAP